MSGNNTGIYYGYPKCCIKEFLSDCDFGIMFLNKRNRRKRTKFAKNGFVPCRKHAILINRKEIKIEFVPYHFPENYYISQLVE